MTAVTVDEQTIDVTVVEDVITLNVYGGGPSGGASDVDDLTTASGTDAQYVNVAPGGGLQYRNPADVLSDIGAETAGSAQIVQGNLDAHAGQTTGAHGGIVADDDSRLADARTPTAHAASHATGQSDAIAAADIGAEPDLGNPATDGFVLSSTIAGVRTWIEMAAGGGGDVEEAPADGTPYSRQDAGWVSALRTSIANTWSAIQTFSAGIVTGIIKAAADATDAIQIQGADGTPVITVDTVNGVLYLNSEQILSNVGTNGLQVGNAGDGNTGESQVAIGEQAGYLNSGNQQTVFGTFAGRENLGNSQTAFGYNAGSGNTKDGFTGVGFQAGYLNTGANSTFFGASAGQSNTGAECTFIGRSVGLSNTTNNRVVVGNRRGDLIDGISTTTVEASRLTINAGDFILPTPNVPLSATATGTAGTIAWDADFVYVCTATNTWNRTAIDTW